MNEMPLAEETEKPSLSAWEGVADHRGPNLWKWMFASVIGASVMLYLSPISSSVQWLMSGIAVALSPLIFLLGWMIGMTIFSFSCEHYRRSHRTWSLRYLLPGLLLGIVGLGFLGSKYWWLFSVALGVVGHRKGTQRAWWGAVVCLAFVFRDPGIGRPFALDDEQALAMAKEAVNKEIGRR